MKPVKIKILFVVTYLELGGAQKQLLYLIRGLDKERYSVYLSSGDKGYLKDEFLKIPGLEIRFIPELVREINPVYDIIAFIKLWLYIKRHRFDIVHTHSPKASVLARWAAYFAGVKSIVYTVHGWPFHKFMNRLSYKFFLYLERLTAKITEKIVVVCKNDLDTGIAQKITPPDKFVLVHYGVDRELAEKVYLERRKTPPPRKNIVNISSLKRQKGLGDFIEAARLILDKDKDASFLIFGGGPLRKKISKMIRDAGLEGKILLKGWEADIASVLSGSTVLALTSWWEGLPMAVIEAAASGVPVVVTDTGGVRDIIKDRINGMIAKPRDVKGIAEDVVGILSDYERWLAMADKNRDRIDLRYWSKERMTEDLSRVYGRLIERT